MMSDFENIDVMLGNGENNPNEKEIDYITSFSIMLDRDDNADTASVRSISSQENEFRIMPAVRDNLHFPRNMETLTKDK